MNKFILIIAFTAFCLIDMSAQQVPQFSQNMFNKLANNPGYAGSRGLVATSVLHRSQWIGFGENNSAGASTQNFSIDAEIPFLKGGVGLNIVKDDIAQFSNLGLQASYAYRIELPYAQIGMGLSIGVFQSGLDGSLLNPSQSGDQAIPSGDAKGSNLDFGTGLYFNTQDVYVGFSSLHLTEPTIEWTNGQDYDLERHYFLIAGYFHDINNVLSLNPSLYLKSDGATSQLDINSNIVYTNQNNNQMWGGVSYRLDEGIILLAGMDITKDLRFGFGYDLTVLNSMSNSFEIMLGYNFKIKANKSLSGYKNPRFL
tara:strand:+ start:10465 stop:11400 length:936 start_codon:yes stop_codon:yes gene_type:complete